MANNKSGWKREDVIFGLQLLGGAVLLFQLKDLFSGAGRYLTDAPPEELQEYVKDKYTNFVDLIKALNINQGNLSQPRSFYKNAAETLYKAMNGIGTNERLLFDTLQGLNKDDLKTVFMDYGMRAPTVTIGLFTTAVGARKDLIQWFIDELGTSDRARMWKVWSGTGLVP